MTGKQLTICGLLGAALVATALPSNAEEPPPSPEEMWRIIQAQQKTIEALQHELQRTQAGLKETDMKVEAAGEMIEERAAPYGERKAARQGLYWGGYGELHYNGGDTDQIDLHRQVFFAGYDFNDALHFDSEIEFEHDNTEENGVVEVEQAFLEWDVTPAQHARGGVILVPVGILNETHEPPTFFGVERNPVETRILPTTWFEGGIGGRGELGGGFSYDLLVHSGLATPTTGANAFRLRNGRRSVSEAPARDPAVTGRLKWTGMPGVELAVTGQYQDDVTQSEAGGLGTGLGIAASLAEAHADILIGGWGLRALYARWDLDAGPAFTGPGALGRDRQWGYYLEPSYRFNIPGGGVHGPGVLGLFVRWSQLDESAGDDTDSINSEFDVGLNYWLHPDVVLKADWNSVIPPSGGGKGDDRLNLGLGWQF